MDAKIKTLKAFSILTFFAFLSSILSEVVSAHCPLCTIGAVAAAGSAAWLGVHTIVIGLFIGAFAISLGFWISKSVKKKYFPYQNLVIILLLFVTTIIPLLPLINDVTSINVWITGGYGSLLNRTYLINSFFLGSLLGGILVPSTPLLSKKITRLRKGKILPFQGTILTLLLLIVLGVIIQSIV